MALAGQCIVEGRRMNDPVVITGVGFCSPLGHTLGELTQAILSGQSGIRAVTQFPANEHPSRIAGSIDHVPCPAGWESKVRGLNRLERALLWSWTECLRCADLLAKREMLKVGVVLGLGCEWNIAWEEEAVVPLAIDSPSALNTIRRMLNLQGPSVTLSAACASGNYAIAVARQWLRLGLVDVCLAGGADMAVTPLTLAGFGNLRALSRRNDEPAQASRPFDRDRDGFVLSEGSAMVSLERRVDADRRGIPILAEIAGFGASSDAYHLVSPCPDGVAAASAIRQALADAQLNADEIDYINAHATGTPLGDVSETKALNAALGSAADAIPVSATKSMSGHLLTAAASFEAIVGIIAMQNSAIPPTINLDNVDPDCGLNHVAHQPQERRVATVLSNSFGFGGSNTALILKRAA
jgi:3-oxoacyl-[acyl-carrier-protein] synthase II